MSGCWRTTKHAFSLKFFWALHQEQKISKFLQHSLEVELKLVTPGLMKGHNVETPSSPANRMYSRQNEAEAIYFL